MMRMSQRKSFVVPSPQEAQAYRYTVAERQIIEMWDAKIISGTGEQVATRLNALQEQVQADELMLLNLGHAPGAIRRSVELIADAFAMPELEGPSLGESDHAAT